MLHPVGLARQDRRRTAIMRDTQVQNGAPVAHRRERMPAEHEAAGSIPARRTINARALDRLSTRLLESGGRNEQPLSPHSVHGYSRAINHFLAWAKREGEPVDAKAHLPKRLVDALSREEIQRREHAAGTERDK